MGGFRDLLVLWLPNKSLVSKFPCILKLPPTNLEWSASFFGLSLPSMYGGQFLNQQLATGEKARGNGRQINFGRVIGHGVTLNKPWYNLGEEGDETTEPDWPWNQESWLTGCGLAASKFEFITNCAEMSGSLYIHFLSFRFFSWDQISFLSTSKKRQRRHHTLFYTIVLLKQLGIGWF